jgi:hypothetical protein
MVSIKKEKLLSIVTHISTVEAFRTWCFEHFNGEDADMLNGNEIEDIAINVENMLDQDSYDHGRAGETERNPGDGSGHPAFVKMHQLQGGSEDG